MKNKLISMFILSSVLSGNLLPQQVADLSYDPEIQNPVYEPGKGSVVFIDEGHNNFHTKNGRYQAFSKLLERDGYITKEYRGEFTGEKLNKGSILVISNALNKKNVTEWYLPVLSAFTKEEIEVVENWVLEGGSLFLIADHMPMGGAAEDLAAAFGFTFYNGFALDTMNSGPALYYRKDKTLGNNIITNGRNPSEQVSQVASFTGQAFTLPDDANPILVFDERYTLFLPDTAWLFYPETPRINVNGWSQGAYKEFGKGKVVAFGEAAMFSAQLAGPDKIKFGMSTEPAQENYQLLLNIIHWLDGKLE